MIQGTSPTLETIIISSGVGPETQLVGFRITAGKDGVIVRGSGKIRNNYFHDLATDAVEYAGSAGGLVEANVMERGGDDGLRRRLLPGGD